MTFVFEALHQQTPHNPAKGSLRFQGNFTQEMIAVCKSNGAAIEYSLSGGFVPDLFRITTEDKAHAQTVANAIREYFKGKTTGLVLKI